MTWRCYRKKVTKSLCIEILRSGITVKEIEALNSEEFNKNGSLFRLEKQEKEWREGMMARQRYEKLLIEKKRKDLEAKKMKDAELRMKNRKGLIP